MHDHDLDLAGALWGALPDTPQTTPRSELFALIMLARISSGDSLAYVDAKVVVDGYESGPEQCELSDMADLWHDFWEALGQRGPGSLRVIWTKSHPSPDEVLMYNILFSKT